MNETTAAERRASRASRAAIDMQESIAESVTETMRTEAPSSLVDLFEKSLARTKDMHEKMTTVLEHSTEALEEAMSCAKRGTTEYRVKLMEIARHNANSNFDLVREAFEVKSLTELFELAVVHQRKQFEAGAAQLRELTALTQKVVSETTEPIRSGMTEPFRIAS